MVTLLSLKLVRSMATWGFVNLDVGLEIFILSDGCFDVRFCGNIFLLN